MHKTPAQREIDACGYWLDQELRTAGLRLIVALGATALKAVLEDSHSRLQDALGKIIEHGDHLVVATYHPPFALRAPDEATRGRAYTAIVTARRAADTLSHQRKRPG